MAEFISRRDINKELIKEVNEDIEMYRKLTKNNEFLTGIISQLNQIDESHFKIVIQEINNSFDLMKFYIDKDKTRVAINPEIPHIIESYLETIILLIPESEFISENARVRAEGKLEPGVLSRLELQELENEMDKIMNNEKKAISEADEYIRKENGIIATSSFDSSILKAHIKQNAKIKTNDIVKTAKKIMYGDIEKIIRQKEKYKIKYKWFYIVTPILMIAMIVCIILPLVL